MLEDWNAADEDPDLKEVLSENKISKIRNNTETVHINYMEQQSSYAQIGLSKFGHT